MTPPNPKALKDGLFVGTPSKPLPKPLLTDEGGNKGESTGNSQKNTKPQSQSEGVASESVFPSIRSANPLNSDHLSYNRERSGSQPGRPVSPPDPNGFRDGRFVGKPSKSLPGLRLTDERDKRSKWSKWKNLFSSKRT